MRFAGTYHPILYLVNRLNSYFPSITDINALWVEADKNVYTLHETAPLRDYLKVNAQNLRNVKSIANWSTSLDFFNQPKFTSQLTLNNEDKMNVLQLFFVSPIDERKDILAFSFPENIFLKNINTTFRGISTHEKQILEKFLLSIFTEEYQRSIEESQFLDQFRKIQKKSKQKISQLSEEIKETQRLYSKAIIGIIQEYKKELEKKLDRTFYFSQDIPYKLAREQLTLEEIKNTIQEAIYLAYNFNALEKEIEVTQEYILLDKVQHSLSRKNKENNSSNGHNKVLDLLDRYETAARRVEQNGEKINGKNIAKRLVPPITPPAITDAVKKNSSKISYFLKQYPEKWTKIRAFIRPISNLDENTNRLSVKAS